MQETRTIRVTGTGMLRLRPDMTRITITLTGCYPDYAEALRRSSEDTEVLKEVLEPMGFGREDIKTLSFSVDTRYENYQDTDMTWKQRFAGYEFRHMLKIEFASDNERLGRILYVLANTDKITPEFRLSYTLKDTEKAKNDLLAKSVQDAREKAVILAEAAGVSLKEIRTIDYSRQEVIFETYPVNNMMRMMDTAKEEAAAGSFAMNIEPDDIEVSDTVTMVWSIA